MLLSCRPCRDNPDVSPCTTPDLKKKVEETAKRESGEAI